MVSISSCQRCGVLACRHLHISAVLYWAWGTSSSHQVHAFVVKMCSFSLSPVMLAEVNSPWCHAGTCRAGSRRV